MTTSMKLLLVVTGCLVIGLASSNSPAVIVTEYKFENTLGDTGGGGGVADTLSGLNGAGGAQAPVYVAGAAGLGQAVVISRTAGNTASLFAPDSADLDLAGAFTIESYVKPDAVGGAGVFQRLLLKWGVSNSYHFGIQGADGNDVNLYLNGGAAGSGGTVVAGQWQHLAAVGDGVGTVRLYRDGTQVASAAYSGSLTNGTDPLTIGQRAADVTSPTHQYSGLVDEVRLHNNAQAAAYLQSRAQLLSPNAANPGSGLVNLYKFEGTGVDTAPAMPQNVGTSATNLTINGSVAFVPGLVGQAADLNGGWLSAPHVADVDLSPTFTIEAWINPDAVNIGFQRLVLNWGAQLSYHVSILGDDVNLFVDDASGAHQAATGGDIVAGQWQHVAAVVNGATASVYLNGLLVGTGSITGVVDTATTEGLGIGDSETSGGSRYSGLIDEVAMWRTALTADQIRTHYLAFNNGFFAAAVPEPATLALAVFGGLALGLRRRRAGR